MPARAPEGHGEAVLALLDIARNELPDHLRHPVDELLADIVLQHVMADFLVVASERLQARHVLRIRDEANVYNPIRLDWNPVLIAERHDVDHECRLLVPSQKELVELRIQLSDLE